MAKFNRANGSTSNILRVFLQDSTSTTGAGKTGLTSASAGLIIATIANNEATATAYTSAGSTTETITTLGTFAAPTATKCRFKEVDATNLPGVYEIQLADARYAVASARSLLGMVTATGIAPCPFEIDHDADADVSKLLGTAWLTPGTAGTPDVNTKTITNGAIAAATFAANALDAVWSTAARTLTSFGTLAADVWAIATSTLTAAGTIGKKLADWVVGTIDTYTGNTKQTGDAFARIGAAGAGLTALGDTRIANLDAAVSSRGTGTALDAAGVQSAVGLATANLDTQLAAIQADSPNRVTKNVALAGFTFFMRDSTNHAAATGLTITAQRSLDGAAFGACANSATEVSNGLYTIDLAAADLNGNVVSLRFTAAGADDLVISFPTQPT